MAAAGSGPFNYRWLNECRRVPTVKADLSILRTDPFTFMFVFSGSINDGITDVEMTDAILYFSYNPGRNKINRFERSVLNGWNGYAWPNVP